MVIVVTGGAGFIGANFIIYMMQKYPANRFICLDKLTYCANLANLQEVSNLPNFRFVQGDICDRDVVERLFCEEQPDIVVNFAAESHVDRSITGPEIFVQTNVLGTQVLLDACLKHKVKRFHQISTDEVYGDLPLTRSDWKFMETTPLKASSPYSATKAGADLLVLAYHRTYGLPVTISRCSNNYGRFQFPEKLIPLMVGKALGKEPLPVYGDGLNVRDWIHVNDHCAAVDLILHDGKVGEVYNIGGQTEISNIEIVRFICRYLQCSEELITYVKDRPGHDLRYAMDTTKINTELGWQPQISFEQGLQKTITWYVEHQQWWNYMHK